jgi:Beta-propeller repeat
MRIVTATLTTLFLSSISFAAPSAASNYGKIPLSFEPNRGQADSKALYLARGTGYLVSLESSGPRILLRKGSKSAQISSRLVGGSGSSKLEALEPLPGHSSYFRGRDRSKWVTGIPNYARVRAAGVYPGIDLVYYGNQSGLEYDFVVSPGADPRAISMRFDGVTSLRIDDRGNLILSTRAGEVTEQKPVIYQTAGDERQPVAGRFVIHSRRTVVFEVPSYDRSRPLVIDPFLAYSSFLGGADTDEGHSVATDASGHLFMTGVTYSTTHGDADVLIRKFSLDGSTILYTADLGGSGDDVGNGIAVDPSGSAYVGGRTDSIDFPTANAFQNGNAGIVNAFVLRLDPSGSSLIFSTYIGGTNDDRGFGLALDNQGSVYLTGAESSVDFPTSNGAFQTRNRGGLDCFVVKFDSQGNGIFSTLIGGGSDDQAFAIAVDPFGNSYITGQTLSDSYPQVNASFQHSRHGDLDAFITEITADGSGLVYSTFAGGSGADLGQGIAVDSSGYAYVVGNTSSSDFPTTNGAFQTGYAGGSSDIFVLAYSPNGRNLLFSTFLGSHGTDEGNGIALDGADNAYIVGETDSNQYPVTGDAVQLTRFGGFDAVVSVLDPTGSQLLYSTFLGGSSDDFGYAIALDRNADIYLTGATSSSDFPIVNAAQPQPGGGNSDAFIAKISFGGSGTFSVGSSLLQRGIAGKFTVPASGVRRKKAKVSPFEDRFRHRRATRP